MDPETQPGRTSQIEQSARLARLSVGGSILAGLGVAACCIGPPLLAALGLGGVAAAARLAPYRPYFLIASVLMLGAGFYLVYGRMEHACRADGSCVPAAIRRGARILLWSAAVVLVVLATSQRWIGFLSG